ncbi:acyltransferase family protein [Pseudarthrobacter sp. NamE5]|uniref:acyltransferase family protein n=1 Tax=Pseudarthrobacter sp. NamE5 TaxID=2576839 RepID=UPI002110496D|nr:acyltransferase family protein [Pseudarthrobacter sp. NamE5]
MLTKTQVAPKPTRSFRGDIQGLRTVAIVAVFLYHLDLPFIPGGFVGVDVFFVISGYLITGLLLKQLMADGRISLGEFYARRAKRLLPAATVVLIATAVLTTAFVPVTRWASIGWDIIASAFYVQNWRLAADSVDYLTSDAAPSPLQHFWSLGVEEQFYLLWPLLLIGAGWLLTRRQVGHTRRINGTHLVRVLLVALSLVLVPSLIWSALYTASAPGPAYFASTTRFWQLAVGALLAVTVSYLEKIPNHIAVIVGWLGMAGIVGAALSIDSSVPYPGVAALLPTLASAAVIAAGVRHQRSGAESILGRKPMLFIGNISYSLYLWHWPLIVVAGAVFGDLSTGVKVALIGMSVALAYLTYRFIEQPVNKMPALEGQPARGLQVGLALTIVGCMIGGGVVQTVRADEGRAEAEAYNATLPKVSISRAPQQPVLVGAMTLPESPRDNAPPMDTVAGAKTPAPIAAGKDFPDCVSARVDETDIRECAYGKRDSSKHVALVGDSHAKQWIPALEAIANTEGWRLTAYIHDACPFATGNLVRSGAPYTACMVWNERMQEVLSEDNELVMVVTSNYTKSAGIAGASNEVDAMSSAFQASWGSITNKGVPVAVIRDTPAPGQNIPDCVAANTSDLGQCAVPRRVASDDKGLAQMDAARAVDGVTAIDLNDFICPADLCAPVIGNVLVYRDSDHLTATYARSLTDRLAQPLKAALPAA